jgi:DNA-binding CsgD family transcriptional regulator
LAQSGLDGTEANPPGSLCLYAVPRSFHGMRVSISDLRGIVHFLDAALSLEPDESFPPAMLAALVDLISSDQIDYFEVRPDRSVISFTTAFEEEPAPSVIDASAHVAHQNPLGPFKWTPADGPLRMSEVISERRLRRLDYYHDFLRPAGIRDRLRVWLWRSPESAACVTFIRADAQFSVRDTSVLAVLQPHLVVLRERAIIARDHSKEADLTMREAQVITMAATGRTNADIGRLLFMSPATVAKHLEHAYRKLHVVGRSEVAASLRTSFDQPTLS